MGTGEISIVCLNIHHIQIWYPNHSASPSSLHPHIHPLRPSAARCVWKPTLLIVAMLAFWCFVLLGTILEEVTTDVFWELLCFSKAVSVISKSSKAPGLFISQRLGSVAVDAASSIPGSSHMAQVKMVKRHWIKGIRSFQPHRRRNRSSCSCRDLHGSLRHHRSLTYWLLMLERSLRAEGVETNRLGPAVPITTLPQRPTYGHTNPWSLCLYLL